MQRAHGDYARSDIARLQGRVYLHCSERGETPVSFIRNTANWWPRIPVGNLKMSVIDTTLLAQRQHGVFGLGLARFISTVSAWNDARATRKALSGLTDRELDDIGLSRGDVAKFSLR